MRLRATLHRLLTLGPQARLDSLVALHVDRIGEALPEGSTSLSGSALIEGHHGHDIDLVVLVPDVPAAAERLRRLYAPLYEADWSDDWAAFRDPGPPQVDVVVTQRGTKGDAHHRRAWDLILSNSELRAEYEELKAAGMDSAEKAAFFDRVVALLDFRA